MSPKGTLCFNCRLSAQQIVEHPFLAVEPEVVIINNPDKTHLTMQVVFKGMDRLSVKFDFNGTIFTYISGH